MSTRYGRGRRKPRWLIAGAGVLGAALVVWVIWAVWLQSNPQVTSGIVSTHIGAHSASATFDVHLANPQVKATCHLEALANNHELIGDLQTRVSPPAAHPEQTSLQVTRTLRTERPATAVELVGCAAPGQKAPR